MENWITVENVIYGKTTTSGTVANRIIQQINRLNDRNTIKLGNIIY